MCYTSNDDDDYSSERRITPKMTRFCLIFFLAVVIVMLLIVVLVVQRSDFSDLRSRLKTLTRVEINEHISRNPRSTNFILDNFKNTPEQNKPPSQSDVKYVRLKSDKAFDVLLREWTLSTKLYITTSRKQVTDKYKELFMLSIKKAAGFADNQKLEEEEEFRKNNNDIIQKDSDSLNKEGLDFNVIPSKSLPTEMGFISALDTSISEFYIGAAPLVNYNSAIKLEKWKIFHPLDESSRIYKIGRTSSCLLRKKSTSSQKVSDVSSISPDALCSALYNSKNESITTSYQKGIIPTIKNTQDDPSVTSIEDPHTSNQRRKSTTHKKVFLPYRSESTSIQMEDFCEKRGSQRKQQSSSKITQTQINYKLVSTYDSQKEILDLVKEDYSPNLSRIRESDPLYLVPLSFYVENQKLFEEVHIDGNSCLYNTAPISSDIFLFINKDKTPLSVLIKNILSGTLETMKNTDFHRSGFIEYDSDWQEKDRILYPSINE